MDTTLGWTVDRIDEPARGLIDLPRRVESMRRHDVARDVVRVVGLLVAAGVALLIVREVLRWVGV